MAKPKKDDAIFAAAKTKLGKAMEALPDNDVDNLVKLANALTKMKGVEREDDTWGGGLGDDK